MHARKVAWLGVVLGLSVSFSAQAEKYLVKFKSQDAFESVAQTMRNRSFLSPLGQMEPMRLFNANASVSEALENVQLLIVDSDDVTAMESLKNHPAVELVEKEIMHPLPKIMITRSGAGSTVSPSATIDRPWGIDAVGAPAAWSVTQGDTARIAVLDTGLDQGHPAIAGRFEKGKNFSGGDSTNISDSIGHGTHVSGTILASGEADGLIGVAPKAKLLMGKVCGALGCPSTAIASGINWAIGEHVDVISMSLGGPAISAGERTALQAAENAGVFVVAASGNDGVARVSYPAAVQTVTAVGAIDITKTKAQFSQWGPELDVVAPGVDVVSSVPRGTGRGATVKMDLGRGLDLVKSLPMVGSPVGPLQGELVYAGMARPADLANVNLTGKIALVFRGEISFKDKIANVLAKGATAAVIYNNAAGLLQGALTEDGSEAAIPAVMIEQTTGEAAKAVLDGGHSVAVHFSIDATDYASFQGTSMATPHVAGVAALIRAANHNLTPAQVRQLLKDTATPLGPNPNNEYGAGLVNADAAVHKALTMAPAMQIAN